MDEAKTRRLAERIAKIVALVVAILMVGAFVVVIGNLAADVVIALIDPRTRIAHA